MSTTKIREVLELFGREATYPGSPRARLAAEALIEVEAIERDASVTRDAALEEVIDAFGTWKDNEPADVVRRMKSQPTRRYLDAETVQEVLRTVYAASKQIRDGLDDATSARYAEHAGRMGAAFAAARDLGLNLDAAPACTCGAKDSSKPETLQAAHYADCPTAHTGGGR